MIEKLFRKRKYHKSDVPEPDISVIVPAVVIEPIVIPDILDTANDDMPPEINIEDVFAVNLDQLK